MSIYLSPLRSDLEISKQLRKDGVPEIVIKDPVSESIFAFPIKAFSILQSVKPGQTIDDLVGKPVDASGEKRQQQVLALLKKAEGCGLLVSSVPASTAVVAEATLAQRIVAKLLNPVWTLKEFRVDSLRPFVAWLAGILFGKSAYPLLVAIGIVSALVAVNYRAYYGSVQIFGDFAWWWVALPILFLSNVWHEMGHYAATLKAGRSVARGGVALMLFFPAFYVRVDNYLMVPKRADRIRIGLGGVYFDAIVFAMAASTWLLSPAFSETNQISYVISFFQLMRIATNLPPFFKLDGCKVFEEWTGIRGIRRESIGAVLSMLGPDVPEKYRRLTPKAKLIFALYAVADAAFMGYMIWLGARFFRINLEGFGSSVAWISVIIFTASSCMTYVFGVTRDIQSLKVQGKAQ